MQGAKRILCYRKAGSISDGFDGRRLDDLYFSRLIAIALIATEFVDHRRHRDIPFHIGSKRRNLITPWRWCRKQPSGVGRVNPYVSRSALPVRYFTNFIHREILWIEPDRNHPALAIQHLTNDGGLH